MFKKYGVLTAACVFGIGTFSVYLFGEWHEIQDEGLRWFLELPHMTLSFFLIIMLPLAVHQMAILIERKNKTRMLWTRFMVVVVLPYIVVATYLAAEWDEIEEEWLPWLIKPSHFLIVLINGIMIPGILWLIINKFIQLWDERERFLKRIVELENELRSFVHPEVYKRIYEKTSLEATGAFKVIMADMQGFTKFCEAHSAAEVANLANEFCNLMDERIRQVGGITLSYAGDLVFALFDEHIASDDIVGVAKKMQETFRAFAQAKFPDWDTNLNIGIHYSRDIVLGTIGGGSAQKHFTANGFGICEVSRMCSEADHGQILVSEAFAETVTSDPIRSRLIGIAWSKQPKNITVPPVMFEYRLVEMK